MKKISILAVAMLAVVASVSAQTKAPKKDEAPKTISCAVMPGDMIKIAEATKNKMFADYKGRRYFFCCAGCPEKFKKDPAKFAKSPSIAIPAKKKK